MLEKIYDNWLEGNFDGVVSNLTIEDEHVWVQLENNTEARIYYAPEDQKFLIQALDAQGHPVEENSIAGHIFILNMELWNMQK